MRDTGDELVRCEHLDGGIAVLRLQHGKVNALSVEVLTQLDHLASGLAEELPRAVVVTGGERVFAAGADITQFVRDPDAEPLELAPPERVGEIGGAFLRALNAVAALQCPTIAAVEGVALGGGCELALACDFRVAAEGARFGQPEILLGIIPGGGGTQRLARLVGVSRAKDLVFSGRAVELEEARSIGLVDRTAPKGGALDVAIGWARELAAGPRHALALAKAAIDEGLATSLAEGLQIEQGHFVQSFRTPDAAAGVASFLAHGPGRAEFG
jgi:enoyl-CoA hydratase